MPPPKPKSCEPYLKALADQTRWRIVKELLSQPATVNELAARLKVPQYNISKHLRVLREAGLIAAHREGKSVRNGILPAFRQGAAQRKSQLDLGCCTFEFDRPPIVASNPPPYLDYLNSSSKKARISNRL